MSYVVIEHWALTFVITKFNIFSFFEYLGQRKLNPLKAWARVNILWLLSLLFAVTSSERFWIHWTVGGFWGGGGCTYFPTHIKARPIGTTSSDWNKQLTCCIMIYLLKMYDVKLPILSNLTILILQSGRVAVFRWWFFGDGSFTLFPPLSQF